MSIGKLVTLGATLVLVTACGETPSEPLPVEASFARLADHDDDPVEIEVEGEDIMRPLFGMPFTDLDYSFKVKSEQGETGGEIVGRAFNDQGDFQNVRGDIVCVTVAEEEPYGVVARVGAVITESESNVRPDAVGSQTVWIVAPGEDGSAQSTFVFIDQAGTFPTLIEFHCGPGIPVSGFFGGFAAVSAKIKVEVK